MEIEENIIKKPIEQALSARYLRYANEVIKERALPDVRTGLKPVVRKVLYDMYELKLDNKSKPKKCARVVGDTLGKFHPHGDTSCYEALVGVSQSWNIRYPLITMDCNNGSIDGDPAAAMRYTECKLSRYGDLLLRNIDKNTVDFVENYDATETEPVVLPGLFPGLLANGSDGIAVGMATSIPPHNLTEIYDACIFMIDRVLEGGDYTLDEIMNYIKAPDFPWGGVITNTKNLKQAYETGKGKIQVRCKYSVQEEELNGRKFNCIRITEIPYKENKAKIIEKIEQLSNDGVVEGILKVFDQTSKENERSVNIGVYLKKHADADLVISKLLKLTKLQKSISFNMMALVNGHPHLLSLINILDAFVGESLDIIVRRSIYENETISKKAHILEGILSVNNNRERAIEILLESENPREVLSEEFSLSDEQTNYIYNMKIRELNNTNIEKVNSDYLSYKERSEFLESIINDQKVALNELRAEIIELKKEYGDERRTTFDFNSKDISEEDLVKDENLVITITSEGIIKSVPATEFSAQKRGGKGYKANNTKDEEIIVKSFSVNSKDTLLFITNQGRGQLLKAYKINKVSRNAKGKHISNYINLEDGEDVISTVALTKDNSLPYIVFVTKSGLIKKLDVCHLPKRNGNACKVIGLKEGDEIVGAQLAADNLEVLIASKRGYATRFNLDLVKSSGRTAKGMKGMSFKSKDDCVVGFSVLYPEIEYFATFSDSGYGKKTKLEEVGTLQSRGGKGVIVHKLDPNFNLVDIVAVRENDDVLVTTTANTLIRVNVDSLSTFSRTACGSKVIFLENNQDIKSIAVIPSEEVLEEAE